MIGDGVGMALVVAEAFFMKRSEARLSQKRPYSRPTLITYGTMTALTKNGHGSRPENKKSKSKNKRA